MNTYEQKIQEKRERYADLATKRRQESHQLHDSGMASLKAIPFGQPILMDHYSAKGDIAYRKKAVGKIEKSFEVGKIADHYESKAEGYGTHGISSDNPEAISLLEEKLEGQMAEHNKMKEFNKNARKNGEEKLPAYMLQNSNGRMKATRDRIKELKAKSEMTMINFSCDQFQVESDQEDNRIKFIFDGKPSDDVRTILKRNAFKWSPTRGAWVRAITPQAMRITQTIIDQLK